MAELMISTTCPRTRPTQPKQLLALPCCNQLSSAWCQLVNESAHEGQRKLFPQRILSLRLLASHEFQCWVVRVDL